MVLHSLNHIFRKSGSSRVEFVRKNGIENLLIVGVGVGKYSHKGMICCPHVPFPIRQPLHQSHLFEYTRSA